jgi:SAM-dependent methyltransferase
MTNDHASVARHYGSGALAARIQEGLVATGLDPASLTTADLAPLDQFHTGGAGATRELAQVAGVQPGMRVLDLGGGIGGPARTLASEFGCDVTVLDLTDEFCRAGEMLTAATALSTHVHFHVGDATDPPFDPASFDVVWTEHATMNITDKPALYRSAARLLRPDGALVMHEITAGERKPAHFPVPWGPDESISHLLAPDALRPGRSRTRDSSRGRGKTPHHRRSNGSARGWPAPRAPRRRSGFTFSWVPRSGRASRTCCEISKRIACA